MDISAEDRRRAFSHWLRTGRLPTVRSGDDLELKFNPWHDPDNGRFTFANTGRRWGGGFLGGGGGRFGGGGATGTYPWPHKQKVLPKPAAQMHQAVAAALISVKHDTPSVKPHRSHHLVRNGYKYEVDDTGRTRRVSGKLTDGDLQTRSRQSQSQAGGKDRRADDDGGHYIAVRFNGPTDAFNHFAQNANFNRGRYRVLEDEWAREKRAGKAVIVKIVPFYHGSSKRPSVINVWFTVNGEVRSEKLINERKAHAYGTR